MILLGRRFAPGIAINCAQAWIVAGLADGYGLFRASRSYRDTGLNAGKASRLSHHRSDRIISGKDPRKMIQNEAH